MNINNRSPTKFLTECRRLAASLGRRWGRRRSSSRRGRRRRLPAQVQSFAVEGLALAHGLQAPFQSEGLAANF